jgi:hypothetical protein
LIEDAGSVHTLIMSGVNPVYTFTVLLKVSKKYNFFSLLADSALVLIAAGTWGMG